MNFSGDNLVAGLITILRCYFQYSCIPVPSNEHQIYKSGLEYISLYSKSVILPRLFKYIKQQDLLMNQLLLFQNTEF